MGWSKCGGNEVGRAVGHVSRASLPPADTQMSFTSAPPDYHGFIIFWRISSRKSFYFCPSHINLLFREVNKRWTCPSSVPSSQSQLLPLLMARALARYTNIWLGSNLKKIMLPNSIWLRSGKPTHTKSAVFFADRSKGGPLFKKFGCKFCIVQRVEIVLKGGFRVISGPWNIPWGRGWVSEGWFTAKKHV